MDPLDCQCNCVRFCSRWNKNVTMRDVEFCKGVSGLPRDTELAYLQRKPGEPPAAPPPPKVLTKAERLAARIAHFAKAMVIELAWRASGGRGPTTKEKSYRRSCCDKNECGLHNVEDDACEGCGCFLEAGLIPPRIMGKLDCATQKCPRGFWGVVGNYKVPPGQNDCCQ